MVDVALAVLEITRPALLALGFLLELVFLLALLGKFFLPLFVSVVGSCQFDLSDGYATLTVQPDQIKNGRSTMDQALGR